MSVVTLELRKVEGIAGVESANWITETSLDIHLVYIAHGPDRRP